MALELRTQAFSEAQDGLAGHIARGMGAQYHQLMSTQPP